MPEPSTFKPVTDAVKQATKDVASQIVALGNDVTSKLRGALDEEMQEVLDWSEKIFDRANKILSPFIASMYNWLKSMPNAFKETLKYMGGLFKIESWRAKLEKAKQGLKEEGILDALMKGFTIVGGILLGALGAALAKVVKPFAYLSKLFKLFETSKGYKALTAFLKGESPIMMWIRKISGKITNSKFITKIMDEINKMMNSKLGKFLTKGIRKGMKYLFWPLQIIFSTIEFFKGFSEENGDIVDKMASGVKAVLKEFFFFPIKIIGDIIDWVADKFGIESLGVSKFFESGFDLVLEALFTVPLALKDGIKWLVNEGFAKAKAKWQSFDFSEIFNFEKIFDLFATIKSAISSYLYDLLNTDAVRWIFGKSDMYQGLMESLKGDIDAAKGMEDKKSMEEEKLKLMRAQNLKLDELNQKALGNQQIVTNEEGGYQGGGPTPDHLPTSRDVTSNPFNDVAWGM